MAEAKANMAFGYHRRGDRFQVDVDEPRVQGLIKGGYITVIEEAHDGSLDDTTDPDRVSDVFDSGLVAGDPQEEEALDGQRETEPGKGDHHRT